jgi:hypothetical protein
VIWWSAGAETPQLLADGEVVMGSTYNGRLFSVIEEQNQPVGMLWDWQVFDFDGWIVPEGLPEDRLNRVMHFLNFATDTQRLADQAKYISYGPARASSQPLVSTMPTLGIEMAPHMPTNPANQGTSWSTTSNGGPTTRTRSRPASRTGSPSSRMNATGRRAGLRLPHQDGEGTTRWPTPPRLPTSGPGSAAAAMEPLRCSATDAEAAASALAPRAKLRALMLVLPLLAFVLITFLMPIGDMLFRSVENQIVPDTLPRTVEALGTGIPTSGERPDEPVYAALHADLLVAIERAHHTRLGSRLNYENAGASRALFRKTGRDVADMDPALPLKEQFIESTTTGATRHLETIRLFSGPPYTAGLSSSTPSTCRRPPTASSPRPENERIYIMLFMRTLVMSLTITATCARCSAIRSPGCWRACRAHANLLMILVLLPFWTSLLVRTARGRCCCSSRA